MSNVEITIAYNDASALDVLLMEPGVDRTLEVVHARVRRYLQDGAAVIRETAAIRAAKDWRPEALCLTLSGEESAALTRKLDACDANADPSNPLHGAVKRVLSDLRSIDKGDA